jgi:tRNA1(Val) A37 N6-methylase TrmN6
MALMFARLARNYAKAGYYPTDDGTLERILTALTPATAGHVRIFDPCAGEGRALAIIQQYLSDVYGAEDRIQSFGIEYDEERAWLAKEALNHCIHSDVQDCIITRRQFGLLFLNPPYGDLVTGSPGEKTVDWKGRKRMEKLFYALTNSTLVFGGVMVLIIPHYTLDPEFATWISRHFHSVRVFKGVEDQFKQVVVFGVRQRVETTSDRAIRDQLIQVGQGELPPVIPERWDDEPYIIPATSTKSETVRFETVRIQPKQLTEVITKHPCLWPNYRRVFCRDSLTARQPLREMSKWHMALALAAGQVFGIVRSGDGRRYLVKGDTYKEKEVSVNYLENEKGEPVEEIVHRDKFVPVIRAIDLSSGPTLGKTLTIR